MFVRISQNSQENTCARVSFLNKVAGLTPATLLKKRLWYKCFPVNFVKFSWALLSQNTSGRLLLSLRHFWSYYYGNQSKSHVIVPFSNFSILHSKFSVQFHLKESFYNYLPRVLGRFPPRKIVPLTLKLTLTLTGGTTPRAWISIHP